MATHQIRLTVDQLGLFIREIQGRVQQTNIIDRRGDDRSGFWKLFETGLFVQNEKENTLYMINSGLKPAKEITGVGYLSYEFKFEDTPFEFVACNVIHMQIMTHSIRIQLKYKATRVVEILIVDHPLSNSNRYVTYLTTKWEKVLDRLLDIFDYKGIASYVEDKDYLKIKKLALRHPEVVHERSRRVAEKIQRGIQKR